VKGLNVNTELLLPPFFKGNPLFIFLVHWLAWLLLHFITFFPTLVNMKIVAWDTFLFTHIVLVSINLILFYIVAFYIMPSKATLAKTWFWVLIVSLLLAIVFTFAKFRLEMYWSQYKWDTDPLLSRWSRRPSFEGLGPFSYRFRTYFQTNILINVSIVIFAFTYRLLLGWSRQQKISRELRNEKLQAELSFLKMQVNPHFLFNALNNIYSLAVLENSRRTGNSILKLSELMRYMLYEKEDANNRVSLDKEIRHLNSYIDLEKLRHQEDIYINFSIEGETQGKTMAPLLLFPLIENACKHGLLNDPEKPVEIQLKVDDHHLNFSISNFNNDYLKDRAGGIGIPNVQKRLDLLYGTNYSVDINKTDERFYVNLRLPL